VKTLQRILLVLCDQIIIFVDLRVGITENVTTWVIVISKKGK